MRICIRAGLLTIQICVYLCMCVEEVFKRRRMPQRQDSKFVYENKGYDMRTKQKYHDDVNSNSQIRRVCLVFLFTVQMYVTTDLVFLVLLFTTNLKI